MVKGRPAHRYYKVLFVPILRAAFQVISSRVNKE